MTYVLTESVGRKLFGGRGGGGGGGPLSGNAKNIKICFINLALLLKMSVLLSMKQHAAGRTAAVAFVAAIRFADYYVGEQLFALLSWR